MVSEVNGALILFESSVFLCYSALVLIFKILTSSDAVNS